MPDKLNHLHFKSPDPRKTMEWYVKHLGAKLVSENNRDGNLNYRLDIHGIPALVTGINAGQDPKRQHYGMEHIAMDTTTFDADVARLKAEGSRLLEERAGPVGKRAAWFEGPEGMQLELLEVSSGS